MDEEEENRLFTVPVDYIYDILDESTLQIDIAKDFLLEILDHTAMHEDVLFHTSEILYANLALSRLTEAEIETAARRVHPETDEEEYILTAQVLQALQTLLLSKYYANMGLSKISYSLSLH
jgi:hypothetical protein